jgi:radical SAM superfamily enzyme YgiQ (UPF0313 family)
VYVHGLEHYVKILLTAINAKYIHSNLAVYCLKAYAKPYRKQIQIAEFTINNYTDDILQAIYKEKPDFIGFSCYIWNIGIIKQLCAELRKLLPKAKIWLGGPEVSYDALKHMKTHKELDGIMAGEGEETFLELLDYYIAGKGELRSIKGIVYREKDKILETPFRPEFDLNSLPFPYDNLKDFKNKIIYYETSRGCPYSCSYCLSSIDKKVRLRDFELVKGELDIFLSQKIPQVKFVDRTFNCNKNHALSIWRYIKEQDNGVTNFHFEISADILGEEEFRVLSSMREGLVQLEIGVQSTNPDTVKAIERQMKLDKLKLAVDKIHMGRNIHEHLDLIAGLPYEDLKTFKKSFNEVYALKPDQFQLGFLKVLKGSAMHRQSREWGIVYQSIPPYEVLYTRWLSYDDILQLKAVEEMVEIYYNSGQFVSAITYMEHFFAAPFDLYEKLGRYYEQNGLNGINHSRLRRYEILLAFMTEVNEKDKKIENERKSENKLKSEDEKNSEIDLDAFRNILVHDLYLRENMKSRPPFASEYELYKKQYRDFYTNEQKIREYMPAGMKEIKAEQIKPYLHLEHYDLDVSKTAKTGQTVKEEQFLLYDYLHKGLLNSQARTLPVKL